MLSLTQVLVLSALLTWLMLGVASLLRTQGWSPAGIQHAFGNRDDLPPATPIAGRAQRAAMNMLENLVIFVAIALALRFAGTVSEQAVLGANIFFWARLIYWPVYLAGITHLRTLIWFVGVIGLALMVLAVP